MLSSKDRHFMAENVATDFFGLPLPLRCLHPEAICRMLPGIGCSFSQCAYVLLAKRRLLPSGVEMLMSGVKNPVFLGGVVDLAAAGHSGICVAAPKAMTQEKAATFAKTHNGESHRSGRTGQAPPTVLAPRSSFETAGRQHSQNDLGAVDAGQESHV